MAVAPERDAQASAQYFFVGGHPLHAQILSNGKDFFRNAALGRPNSLRAHPKNFLMQIQSALQLLARVFGMAKTILRQGQARGGNRAHVGIADQRQNRVIERGGRNLDSSVLRRFGVRGQDFGQQFALPRDHEALIVQRVIRALFESARDIGIVQKEFVEPGDLRKHLQIGKVLRLKKLLGCFRGYRRHRESGPRIRGTGDSAQSDVFRIGLEQILQRKVALVRE